MLKLWRIIIGIIDVDGDISGGRLRWDSPVCCYDNQMVFIIFFPIQTPKSNDDSRIWMYCETFSLTVSQTVTEIKI